MQVLPITQAAAALVAIQVTAAQAEVRAAVYTMAAAAAAALVF
jgi:hypothetical protein